jgi:hypothetical protein
MLQEISPGKLTPRQDLVALQFTPDASRQATADFQTGRKLPKEAGGWRGRDR